MADLFDGYANFAAEENDFGDGLAHCAAVLDVNGAPFQGNTQNLRGHAEMDALSQYLHSIQWSVRNFSAGVITCQAKPCCVQCATVLGALGVAPGLKTYKSRKTMTGGGAWGLSPDFRKFLKQYGFAEDDILAICSANQKQMWGYLGWK